MSTDRRHLRPGRPGARLLVAAVILLLAGCDSEPPLGPVCTAADVAAGAPLAQAPLAAPAELPPSPFDDAFRAAGDEFGVPASVLKALGWIETRWQMVEGHEHGGLPAAYGVMALRGERLARGAALAGVSVESARRDPVANIRSAAALLAAEAAEAMSDPAGDAGGAGGDAAGDRLERWAAAVAGFSGIGTGAGRADYVARTYTVLRDGLESAPDDAGPRRVVRSAAAPAGGPGSLDPCAQPRPPVEPDHAGAVWRPSPNSNARPSDATGAIHTVIVHTCEGSYSGCWSWLTNPQSGVSSHYVVDEGGHEISQLVREPARAWHIGARYDCALNHGHDCWMNDVQSDHFTIGIEHAGYASQPSFPAGQIDASARLVCEVTRRHDIPRDPQHIVAHGRLQPYNRTDPGPNWPWTEYIGSIQRHCGELVVDDDDGWNVPRHAAVEASGTWAHSRSAPGYYGDGYRWASTDPAAGDGGADDPVVYRFLVEAAGEHVIQARWVPGDNRTAAARYAVVRPGGTVAGEVEVDQREGGGWHELGRWELPAGWAEVRLSRAGPAGAVVVADAIRVR